MYLKLQKTNDTERNKLADNKKNPIFNKNNAWKLWWMELNRFKLQFCIHSSILKSIFEICIFHLIYPAIGQLE